MSRQRKPFSCKSFAIFMICTFILSMLVSIVPWVEPNGGLWLDVTWANLPPFAQAELPGLNGTIHIVRDQWGVPHIFARSESVCRERVATEATGMPGSRAIPARAPRPWMAWRVRMGC